MLLAVDVGNTQVVLGLFREGELMHCWRLRSDTSRTPDQYAVEILLLLSHVSASAEDVTEVAISCVVPPLRRVFDRISLRYFSVEPIIVDADIERFMPINCDKPETVGSDRIVNAIACRELVGSPAVVVDFGTATTFDIIGPTGAYEGGVIAPGMLISAEALFERAALLSSVEIVKPPNLIGKNTRDCMLSGIYFGYVSLVQGLLEKIRAEMQIEPSVIATGGLSRLLAEDCSLIQRVVPDLTLQGLRIVSDYFASPKSGVS